MQESFHSTFFSILAFVCFGVTKAYKNIARMNPELHLSKQIEGC